MNYRSWTLHGLEFRMLMEHAGRDRLPFPIQFQPTADSGADYHRQRHEARGAVDRTMDDDLRVAVDTLVAPQVRIEVVGHRTSSGKVRGHAAVGHDVAVVLTQGPGDSEFSGGPVTVTLLESFRAVTAVLAVLPTANPGTSATMTVAEPGRAADDPQSPLIRRASRRTDDERFEKLFSSPPSCAGEILVCTGPATDNRFEDGTTGVNWVDFDGDGRYLIRHGSMLTVTPASSSDFAAHIADLVTRALWTD